MLSFLFTDDSESEALTVQEPLLGNTRTDKVIVYWVSYLEGLQRVLLFTQDERIARRARKVRDNMQQIQYMYEQDTFNKSVMIST